MATNTSRGNAVSSNNRSFTFNPSIQTGDCDVPSVGISVSLASAWLQCGSGLILGLKVKVTALALIGVFGVFAFT